MSALEIIEQIKALPPQELVVVAEFIHQMEASLAQYEDSQCLDRAAFESTAEKVFDRYYDSFRKLAQ